MTLKDNLDEFAEWVKDCSGSEKRQGRTFLEKFFKAWGWRDTCEAKVLFEEPIPYGSMSGGTGEADALIKGEVIIEMKSRKENLLNLNLEISTKEKKNQNVVGPWAPT